MSCISMTSVPMRTKFVTQLSVMSAIVTRWCTKCCQKSLRFVSNACVYTYSINANNTFTQKISRRE